VAIGSVWGTREELLHPRDRHGRFRKKWKMAEGVANKILGFLDAFSPRMFQNDAQAAQYNFNSNPTPWNRGELTRLHMDYDEANEHLRTGDMDDSTKQFVQMMDRHKTQTRDDIIVSRTVGPEAFGLTAEQMSAEDGGIEDYTGKLIADRGYGAVHMGGILGGQAAGPGKVTMRIAVPKGTSVVIPARNRDDRGLFLDRDQELRVTKVQPDGAGGYYVLAVATPRTEGETPEPVSRSPRGVGLTPEQREARIAETEAIETPSARAERQAAEERIAQAEAAGPVDAARRKKRIEDLRIRQVEQPQEAPQTTEQLPQGVEPRNEPIITPGQGQAPAPTPAATPEPPAGVSSSPNGQQFRQIVRDAELPSPSRGNRRVAWNDAYLGIASGKKDPFDVLRELDRDVETFKAVQTENQKTGVEDTDLPGDIDALEQLGDLIRREFGAPRRETPTPEPETAPVKKAAARAKKAVSSEGGTKAAGLTPEQRAAVQDRVSRMKTEGKFNPDNPEHQRLQSLVDQMTPAKKAVKAPAAKKAAPTKAAPAKAAPAKATVPEAEPSAPEAKPQWGTIKSFGGKSGDIVMYHWSNRKGPREGRPVRIETRAGGMMYDLVDPETGKVVTSNGVAHRAWLSPGPSGAPVKIAKKAPTAKAAPAAKKAVPEAPAEKPLEKNTVSELRSIALNENVTLPKRALKADIVKAIQDARGGKGAPDLESAARTRQADIDRVRPVAEASGQIEQAIDNGTSADGLRKMINDHPGLSDEQKARLTRNLGNRGLLFETLQNINMESGLSPVRSSGETGAFDRRTMRPMPGSRISDGAPVQVVRPGYVLHRDGEQIEVSRPIVEEITPEEARAAERGLQQVPEGSVSGPKAQTPISTPERRGDFKQAWSDADIKAPGSAGRSLTEIRDDISTGKITPEEGVRRLESEISLNKEELADIDATLRGDMSPADRRKLVKQAEDLEAGIAAQEKASDFVRGHTKNEAPVTEKEILQVELPADVHEAIAQATPDDLKDGAVKAGLRRPKGESKDEVIQDIARQFAEKELADRATKAAKKAAPKKAAPPDLPTEPGKLDARVLSEGLDLPGHRLDGVQKDLDAGKSPSEIGKTLEQDAKFARTMASLKSGGVRGEDRLPGAQAELDEARREAAQLEELAKRLRAIKRPRAKKAAPAKRVAPEVKVAEARADSAENRILQTALDRLQAAKSETQARDALTPLTMPELRELGRQHGVTGRSKESIIKGLVDRHINPKPPEPPAPKPTKKATPGLATVTPIGAARSAGTRTPAKAAPERVTPVTPTEIQQDRGERLREIARRQSEALREATGRPVMSDKPIIKNTWGSGGGEVHYHPDGAIGQALRSMGDDQRLTVDGDALANVMGRLATDVVAGRKTVPQMIDELKKLRDRVPDGSKAKRGIESAIKEIDSPKRSIKLPDGSPKPLQDLADALTQIPLASKPMREGDDSSTSELDELSKLAQQYRNGEISRIRLISEMRQKLQNRRHESQEGKLTLDRAVSAAISSLQGMSRADLPNQMTPAGSTSWGNIRDKVEALPPGESGPRQVGDLIADLSPEELRKWADSLKVPKNINTKSSLIQVLIDHYADMPDENDEE
jgi:hypothetical protein